MRTIIVFVFLNSMIFAQTLTLTDIVFVKNHTLSESEEYLSKRGYDFKGKTDHLSPQFHKYVFKKAVNIETTGDVLIGAIVNKEDNTVSNVEIIMQNRSNYIAIRQRAIQAGYLLVKENQQEEIIITKYIRGKSSISFSAQKTEDLGAFYYISFW